MSASNLSVVSCSSTRLGRVIAPVQRCCWTVPALLCRRLQAAAGQNTLQSRQSYAGAQSFHVLGPQQQAHHEHVDRPLQEQSLDQHVVQQQQQQKVRDHLSWQELHRAAQIAAWSGLCYRLPDELQARIQQQHLQLTLLAHGRNEYTAWYIADGVVPHANFCSRVRQRTSVFGGGSKTSNPPTAVAADGSANGSANASAATGQDQTDDVCAVPEGVRERFVVVRGVQWSAHDVDSRKMSQMLMRLWPAPFPRTSQRPPQHNSSTTSTETAAGTAAATDISLVAHQGAAEVATDLYGQLRPYLDQADDVGMPVCFAGHSLGGSLALLTMALYQINSRRRQHNTHPTCYTFGSPPVLAHKNGGGGHRVLQALRLPPASMQNFVLENDPVPRALLSVDPTFEMLKEWSAVKGLLQLRGLIAGEGSPLSPGRFLFEAVGQVQLIKWTPEGGSEVVPLDAHEVESELSFMAQKPTTVAAAVAAGTPAAAAAAATAAATAAVNAADSSSTNAQVVAGGVQETAAAVAAGGFSGIVAAVSQFVNPLRAVQSLLDHQHGSYAQELEAAARRGIRQAVEVSKQ